MNGWESTGGAVVTRFNDFIAARDIAGLGQLMTDDHVFIDSGGGRVIGKVACLKAWRGFFETFPDYSNEFSRFSVAGDELVVVGRSICSDPRLDGPAIWTAKISGNQVSQWQVHDDTPANRTKLGLPA